MWKLIRNVGIIIGAFLLGNWIGFETELSKPNLVFMDHLLSGLIFGAIGIELIPKLVETKNFQHQFSSFIGLTIGAISMIVVRNNFVKQNMKMFVQRDISVREISNWEFVFDTILELIAIGLIVGIIHILTKKHNIHKEWIIMIALIFEVVLLGTNSGNAMKEDKIDIEKRWKIIGWAILLIITAFVFGNVMAGNLTAVWSTFTIIGFAVSILIWISVEELLRLAHGGHERYLFGGVMLYVGFFSILLLSYLQI